MGAPQYPINQMNMFLTNILDTRADHIKTIVWGDDKLQYDFTNCYTYMQKIFDNKKMSRLKPGEKVQKIPSANSSGSDNSNRNKSESGRSDAPRANFTGTIEDMKYDFSVYKTFTKQQKNQLQLLRLKSSGDGKSSGQKQTLAAIMSPENAAEKKKKKQGTGVRFGSSGRMASIVE